jgi:hypothetical protein
LQRRSDEFQQNIELKVHPNVAEVFKGQGARLLKKLETKIGKKVILATDSSNHQELFQLRAHRPGK